MTNLWHDQAIQMRRQGFKIRDIATKVGRNYYTVRDFLRTQEIPQTQFDPIEVPKSKPPLTTTVLLDQLKRTVNLETLFHNFEISALGLRHMTEELVADGYVVNTDEPGFLSLRKNVQPLRTSFLQEWNGGVDIKIGAVTDTHLGSRFQQVSFLKHAYDIFRQKEISQVYHAGDITDGVNMYRGHEYEVFLHGADAQVQYVANYYPKVDGIETYFITGNHDLSSVKLAGHDIGVSLASKRSDLHYLGPEYSRIMLTPACSLDLWHGRDGSAYAHSYALQKYIEAIPGGDKPKILFAGHRHKAIWTFERNVHAYEGGCFQAQTGFMRGKKLAAHIGFYIITIKVHEDGTVMSIGHEFFPLYNPIQNDF